MTKGMAIATAYGMDMDDLAPVAGVPKHFTCRRSLCSGRAVAKPTVTVVVEEWTVKGSHGSHITVVCVGSIEHCPK
jgi:hypothetical protein